MNTFFSTAAGLFSPALQPIEVPVDILNELTEAELTEISEVVSLNLEMPSQEFNSEFGKGGSAPRTIDGLKQAVKQFKRFLISKGNNKFIETMTSDELR